MRVLRVLSILIAILVVTVLAVAAFKPDVFRVERSTTIAAPAPKVAPFVDDFRRWTLWSPFEHKDPTLRRRYGERTVGEGGPGRKRHRGRSSGRETCEPTMCTRGAL